MPASSDGRDAAEALVARMKDFEDNVRIDAEIPFPVEVASVKTFAARGLGLHEAGAWCAVRPVDNERTYLGVYLGDLPTQPMHHYHMVSKELTIMTRTNPALWVPDLVRVVWGYESWWSVLKSPEDLRKITDADIQNVWYVRALKALTSSPEAPVKP